MLPPRTATVVLLCLLVAPPAAEARRSKTGRLVVLSTTSGADILLDGKRAATVPSERPFSLSPGEHTVRVELRGYTSYEQTIRIRPGKEMSIEADLIAHSGILMVETPGVTAQVLVDGKPLGPTPFDDEVTIGDRTIEVQARGYVPYRTRQTVKGGQFYPISVELQRDPDAPPPEEEGPTGPPWWENPWVWVGAGAAVLTVSAIGVGLSLADDNERPEPDARLRILEGYQ